jgi:N-acetylmuramoyl-L-alanine amidase
MKARKKLVTFAAVIMLTITSLSAQAYAANYKVIPNDTLYKISNLFGTTVSTLKSDNNLNSDMIYPGQILNVRSAVYTVKSGDTLYLIAKKHGISLYSLRRANAKWDDMIYPGQKLTIPGIASSNAAQPVTNYTSSDLDLLARLVEAEAADQPYKAKVAVAAVVVNRVESSEWPNTIKDVIYHVSGGYHQFTPVKNGWINKPASQESIKAAREALYGSDPSSGAMFYFDDSATNKWLWSKPQTAYIGRMVFVK